MSLRDIGRYSKFPVTVFSSLARFYRSALPDGIVTIDYNGLPLDLLIKSDPTADTTIVVFHAATARDATHPVFTGLGVTQGIRANLVFVSDPTLAIDPDVILGWFAGNSRQPLQAELPQILTDIVKRIGGRYLVFYGPSGGGFATLYYSAQFPGSLAIPTNPQTVLGNFHHSQVTSYVSAGFGPVGTVEEALKLLDYSGVVHDLRNIYAKGVSNTVAYLQNIPDTHHIQGHFMPYATLVKASPNVRFLLGNWGPRHHAPPKGLLQSVLNTVAEASGGWHEALDSLGFLDLPSLMKSELGADFKVGPNFASV